MLSETQIVRYARHISLSAVGMRGQKRLLRASVRLRLRGDTASHCALIYLAAAGVGRIAIDDAAELVSESEVNASLAFDASDVGATRFEAASRAVAALNPDVEIALARPEDPDAFEIERAEGLAAGLSVGCAAAARIVSALATKEAAKEIR